MMDPELAAAAVMIERLDIGDEVSARATMERYRDPDVNSQLESEIAVTVENVSIPSGDETTPITA